jgi:hypothetical protein
VGLSFRCSRDNVRCTTAKLARIKVEEQHSSTATDVTESGDIVVWTVGGLSLSVLYRAVVVARAGTGTSSTEGTEHPGLVWRGIGRC